VGFATTAERVIGLVARAEVRGVATAGALGEPADPTLGGGGGVGVGVGVGVVPPGDTTAGIWVRVPPGAVFTGAAGTSAVGGTRSGVTGDDASGTAMTRGAATGWDAEESGPTGSRPVAA